MLVRNTSFSTTRKETHGEDGFGVRTSNSRKSLSWCQSMKYMMFPLNFDSHPLHRQKKDPKGPVQIGLTEHYLIWLRGRGVMQQLQRKERLCPWQKLGNHKFTSWISLSKWSRFLLQSRQVSWVSGIWKEMIANTRFRKTPHRTTGNQGIVFQWLIPSILSLLLLFATNKIQTQGREYKVYLSSRFTPK